MKLSKIKKVCTDALQLRVVDTCGQGNNMVHQWVGTQEALYPVEGMTLSEEMLKVLWELSDKQVATSGNEQAVAQFRVAFDNFKTALNQMIGAMGDMSVEIKARYETAMMQTLRLAESKVTGGAKEA